MHSIPTAMLDDDDCTLVRRDQKHADPTSWNGISYDDMMRSLEDALPSEDRATLVGQLPTRPVAFQPAPITQRIVTAKTTQTMKAMKAMKATPPMAMPITQPMQTSSVAPVALPSIALRYVDLDADFDPDAGVDHRTNEANAARPSKRAIGRGMSIGAFIGVLAIAAFVWTNPEAHGRASSATGDARAFMSSYVTNATAKTSQHSTAAATPIAAAPVAPPIAVQPVATPVALEPPAVPTMRSPTPPPARPAVKAKARNVEAHDETNEHEADPGSLLDRGLGQ